MQLCFWHNAMKSIPTIRNLFCFCFLVTFDDFVRKGKHAIQTNLVIYKKKVIFPYI